MARILGLLTVVVVGVLAGANIASAHPERPTHFPKFKGPDVPQYRNGGTALVVCKPDSKRRIVRQLKGRAERRNLRLLKKCKYRHIQQAVDAAKSRNRILILPGVYREEPSQRVPTNDKSCAKYVGDPEDRGLVPTLLGGFTKPAPVAYYDYHFHCPNSQNLIAIMGDSPNDGDDRCDLKCDLQIEGTGSDPKHVLISGDRHKLNALRADRADGIYLTNFTIEYSDFNNVYALETDGFVFSRIVSRYAREYGLLSFVSDNGLYDRVEGYAAGDSALYAGSGPEGHCERFGIEVRNSIGRDSNLGWSGTAGNGTWVHDSKFYNNSAGVAMDSFAPGHPGQPQDCSKFTNNEVFSNNNHANYDDARDRYCQQPIEKRDGRTVCPTFQVPVGTGFILGGVNGNTFEGNWVYDNHREGVHLVHVPAVIRGENDLTKIGDTSHNNRFVNNHFGRKPDGSRSPNGLDVWWTEQGHGNCWSNNDGSSKGGKFTSDPAGLPECPAGNQEYLGNYLKLLEDLPCGLNWNPQTNPNPQGCNWFDAPPVPE